MKKLISVAAFLAASSALASVATDDPVIITSFGENNDGSAKAYGSAIDYSLASVYKSSSADSTEYTTDITDSYQLSTLNWNFMPTVNVSSDGQWQAVFSYGAVGSDWNFTGVVLNAIAHNGTGWNSSVSGNVSYTVEYAIGENTTPTWTSLGTVTQNIGGNGSPTALSFDSGTIVAIGAEDSFNLRVSTSKASSGALNAYAGLNGIQIIPEPSAFGLLAGAGALVLVAARRRRSRKA